MSIKSAKRLIITHTRYIQNQLAIIKDLQTNQPYGTDKNEKLIRETQVKIDRIKPRLAAEEKRLFESTEAERE